jgi:hypothetical protein
MSLVAANGFKNYTLIGIDLPTPESYLKICSVNEGLFQVVAEDSLIQ